MPTNFPRVLLLTSSAFNPYSGGGITLTNLFRGWPRERLAVAHNDVLEPDPAPCGRYYLLRDDELGPPWPLNVWSRRRRKASATGAGPAGMAATSPPPARAWRRWAQHAVRAVVSDAALQDRATLTPELRAWVSEFRPEVIYTFLGSRGVVRLARRLAAATGAPVVVHMMDDWPQTRYRGAALSPLLRAASDRELRALFRMAALRMGIGQAMCDEYRRRYGLEFLPFHNVLDIEAWQPHVRREWNAATPLKLLYAGSILPDAQRDSLVDVAEAVEELRRDGFPAELHLHTPFGRNDPERGRFDGRPGVILGDAPEGATIAQHLAGADVLVLPVNFDEATVKYVRLSFPTKLPAYLLSGTPILAYGPTAVEQIRLAAAEGWGHVVPRRERNVLKSAVRELGESLARRESLGRRAQEVARRDHDAERVRPQFQAAIASVR